MAKSVKRVYVYFCIGGRAKVEDGGFVDGTPDRLERKEKGRI